VIELLRSMRERLPCVRFLPTVWFVAWTRLQTFNQIPGQRAQGLSSSRGGIPSKSHSLILISTFSRKYCRYRLLTALLPIVFLLNVFFSPTCVTVTPPARKLPRSWPVPSAVTAFRHYPLSCTSIVSPPILPCSPRAFFPLPPIRSHGTTPPCPFSYDSSC